MLSLFKRSLSFHSITSSLDYPRDKDGNNLVLHCLGLQSYIRELRELLSSIPEDPGTMVRDGWGCNIVHNRVFLFLVVRIRVVWITSQRNLLDSKTPKPSFPLLTHSAVQRKHLHVHYCKLVVLELVAKSLTCIWTGSC